MAANGASTATGRAPQAPCVALASFNVGGNVRASQISVAGPLPPGKVSRILRLGGGPLPQC